ncbi:MAG: response regulator [Candidatus Omnitrophota bacterium]
MNIFGPPKRILVADDEPDVCLYLKRYLERRKFHVTTCFDGAEARKVIGEQKFDYFLLDCSMPNVTGLELVESARRNNPGAKIVLISGFPAVNDTIIQKLGGDRFVHKPIQLSEIDQIFQEDPKEEQK